MKIEQSLVRDFHIKAEQVVNDKPTKPDHKTLCLRAELINEEWKELIEAMGVYSEEGIVLDWFPTGPYNQTSVADALGDLLYVVLGTAVSCGIDIEPIFHEIHRSNMSKFIDGHCRADGKWVKGPSYSPANLQPILDVQGA